MNTKLSKVLIATAMVSLTPLAFADSDKEADTTGTYHSVPAAFSHVAALEGQDNRRGRRGSYHGHNRHKAKIWPYRQNNHSFEAAQNRGNRAHFGPVGRNQSARIRADVNFFSFTSQPLRGGSSRRTRVIENPYSDRLVTGITLTGVDNRPVHIRDVVAYPGRQLLSPLAYSLSQFSPPRFINTYNYIDYISVAAKRKEYFTVTFHYD